LELRNHAIADTGDVEGCCHVTDAEGERVIEIWGDADKDEANSRLIAAAPDLLDAVRMLLPLAKGYAPPHQSDSAKRSCADRIEAAEAAIAKATESREGAER
jgi:hypothetical protein